MIENGYVRKRKRKKFIGVLSAVATGGMGVLIAVSFLGRFVGTFTISLNSGNVKLSLSEKSSFDSSSSFLKVDSLPPFGQSTYTSVISSEETSAKIDNEDSSYLMGARYGIDNTTIKSLDFFKYTFFIKNSGSISAEYYVKINIIENKPSADGRYLDSMLRILVYENDASTNNHEYTVYAKPSESGNIDEDGNTTFKEYISYSIRDAERKGLKFPGFAEPFESDKVAANIPVKYFDKNEMKRYTIVTWIEGYDPQSNNEAPEGASLKLGVEINAYENKQ